jgi:vacuolar-type H+-ATPase subunit I/STV1
MTTRQAARLDVLIWVLIYGGLLTAIAGLFVFRQDPAAGDVLGTVMMAGGIVAAVAGAVLVHVRSRLGDER